MIARKAQKLIYNILILCFLTGGIIYVCSRFIHLGNIEYTDNAQVKQHITPINTRVPGFIKKICFAEYQQVRVPLRYLRRSHSDCSGWWRFLWWWLAVLRLHWQGLLPPEPPGGGIRYLR